MPESASAGVFVDLGVTVLVKNFHSLKGALSASMANACARCFARSSTGVADEDEVVVKRVDEVEPLTDSVTVDRREECTPTLRRLGTDVGLVRVGRLGEELRLEMTVLPGGGVRRGAVMTVPVDADESGAQLAARVDGRVDNVVGVHKRQEPNARDDGRGRLGLVHAVEHEFGGAVEGRLPPVGGVVEAEVNHLGIEGGLSRLGALLLATVGESEEAASRGLGIVTTVVGGGGAVAIASAAHPTLGVTARPPLSRAADDGDWSEDVGAQVELGRGVAGARAGLQ